MKITISTLTGDIFNFDISEDLELENLKALCGLESGVPTSEMMLLLDGKPLTNNSARLKDCGIKHGEMLLMQRTDRTPTTSHSSQSIPRIDFSEIQVPGSSSRDQMMAHHRLDDPAILRNFLLSNPHDLALLKERNPVLADALLSGNTDKFVQVYNKQQEERAAKERERIRLITADPFDADAQQKIAEQIRLKNVDSNMETAMEYAPESFGQVTMLYIDCKVNNKSLKAFVDSGAQMTIMSQACAERCNLMRLVDTRWSGIAKGVGVQQIIGRIHLCQVEIGGVFMACSFSVLKDQSMDMLLGLDMLKRHQCIIDLHKNALFIGTTNTRTPFLGEGDLPMYARLNTHVSDDESVMEDTDQAAILDSIRNRPITDTSSEESIYSEAIISQITSKGFTRQEAIQELSHNAGNIEKALAILIAKSLKFPSF